MKPGRELDLLVAEKVMGVEYANEYYCGAEYPKYSTDISAAWEVVEKLTYRKAMHFQMYKNPIQGFLANFVHMVDCDRVWTRAVEIAPWAPTAPHAICLAALKYKGVEIDK